MSTPKKLNLKDLKNDTLLLAKEIIAEQPTLVQSNRRIYIYNGKHYEVVDLFEMKRHFRDFCLKYDVTALFSRTKSVELYDALLANRDIKEVEFDKYPDLLCLNNGVLKMDKTMKLYPHSEKLYFSSMVDCDYDPSLTEADCPHWMDFLRDTMTDEKGEVDEDTVQSLLSIGGYALYPMNKLKRLFILLGEGSNGKSVYLDTLKMFFPRDKVTSLTLQDLSSDGFVRSTLLKSRINISPEAKSNAVDAEEIKKIISGEQITINQKFQEPIDFMPFTKLFVASNTRPYFNDTTHALDRRLVVITFKNRYLPRHEYDKVFCPIQNRVRLARDGDVMMDEFKEEKSAILSVFIGKLLEYLNEGWFFKETQNMLQSKEEYKETNDPAGTYLKMFYEPSGGVKTMAAQDVLAHYREWHKVNVSEQSNLKFSASTIGRKLTEIFRIEGERVYTKDRGQLTYYPIKFRNYENEFLGVGTDFSGGGEVGSPTQGSLLEDTPF